MRKPTLRNIGLVARREYIETVRTKAFLIMTLLTPAIMFGFGVLPSLLATMKTGGERHIVVVAQNADYGNAVKQELERSATDRSAEEDERRKEAQKGAARNDVGTPEVRYRVDVSTTATDAERTRLQKMIDEKQIDAFLWLDDEAVKTGKMTYTTRSSSDFVEMSMLRVSVRRAITNYKLAARGVPAEEMKDLTKPYEMETIQWVKGKAQKTNQGVKLMSVIFLTLAMYMTVLIYGIGVMRAVLEEKKSRIMEVLMSAVTSTDLMAGKILGVGAVGLTQIAIWGVMGAVLAAPGAISMGAVIRDANITGMTLAYFAVFFLLGYMLYSSLCAAVGAMVNSEQEAQQLQFFVMMPMILSMILMMFVLRAPNDPRVVAMSFFPFCTPLLMYMRIIVEQPPLWQIWTSIGLLILTILVVLWVAGRIYRVGVLMYGKKPNLPEIIKWVKYA